MSAAPPPQLSPEDEELAIETRAFAKSYETALITAMESDRYTITPKMLQDISEIMTEPNPLIRVELFKERLKRTQLGEAVYNNAILGNDHGVSERAIKSEKRRKEEHERLAAERLKALRDVVAIQAARVGEKKQLDLLGGPVETPQESEYRRTHPYGTYSEVSPEQAAAAAAAAAAARTGEPFSFSLPRSKTPNRSRGRGGKKSGKKGRKNSHKKRTHRRRH